MSSPSELQRMFFESVPASFIEETVRCLMRSYRFAQDACTQYDDPEAHDLFSHVRRAHFQGEWRRIAKHFNQLHATAPLNKAKNAHHTKIAGGRIILTESAVNSPTEVPRRAQFRKTYARHPQIGFPFSGIENNPAPGAPLYSLFIHGPARAGRLANPEFAFIGFPDPDCTQYVARIDLRHVLDRILPEFGVQPMPAGDDADISKSAQEPEFGLRLKLVPGAGKKEK